MPVIHECQHIMAAATGMPRIGTHLLPISLLALSLSRSAVASPAVVDDVYTADFTARATSLRSTLLSGYDKSVPASGPRLWYDGYNHTAEGGTDVAVQVRFFKVDWVDPTTGSMKVKVWLRMKWIDTRLSWDPQQHNLSRLQFNNPYLEEPEIWLPDITTYNSRGTNLEASVATVMHTGMVFWSRPGIADVMCKFHGLAQFPFDKLKCGIDMGGWAYSGLHQGIHLWGPGFSFSTEEATAGSSYQEFAIERIDSSLMLFTYDESSSEVAEPWPLIHYDITLHRAYHFYVHVLVWPGIIITAASLAVFYVSPICGERLGFGVHPAPRSLLQQQQTTHTHTHTHTTRRPGSLPPHRVLNVRGVLCSRPCPQV